MTKQLLGCLGFFVGQLGYFSFGLELIFIFKTAGLFFICYSIDPYFWASWAIIQVTAQ